MIKQEYNGLSSKEAEKKLYFDGENVLISRKKVSGAKIFASQFKDVLVLILLGATVVSIIMGDLTEAIAITAIIFINSLLGFFQEFKTEKTMEALKKMASPKAVVIRDGQIQHIDARQVVVGDLLLLEAGDRVAADGIVLQTSSLQVDESLLTGESVSVSKLCCYDPNPTNQLNRSDMVYMGTLVTKGKGRIKVTHTGMSTQMGQIAHMIGTIEEEPTPLQKRLAELGKGIGIGCLIICAVVAVAGILRGEEILNMLITGISLAVAAVPEGLPAIVTIALALSVSRMVKHRALIRRLHAVETLGCASVVCSDKTGTLTQNKMTVKQLMTADGTFEMTGDGYRKEGYLLYQGNRVNLSQCDDIRFALKLAVLCNNAQIDIDEKTELGRNRGTNTLKGEWKVAGEPTEIALHVAAAKVGVSRQNLLTGCQIIDEVPFDSDRKCMSVVTLSHNGDKTLVTKGAPDILLKKSSHVMTRQGILPLTPSIRNHIQTANDSMAQQALRVIAVAFRDIRDKEEQPSQLEENLVFVGLIAMQDPPRKEAKQAVSTCRRAGIKPVMITGDHKATACAIAAQVGIYQQGDRVITGNELDMMDDVQLSAIIEQVSVFARVNPSHKLKIVRAFKRCGHIVAMTGDGVNDAPAIKEADIGIAMGLSGTDVTKEAAEVILLDDNFATIIGAIEEGRVIYSNIRKFIRYLLSCNIGEVLTMFLGILAGMPMVLFPIQILLINLVTDGLPAIALGLEPPEEHIMWQKPRSKTESVFSNGLLTTIVFRGCLIGLSTLATYSVFIRLYTDLSLARTAAFMTLVLTQLIHVFECKSETKSLFHIRLWNNIKLVLAVMTSLAVLLCAVYLAPLQVLFKTTSLSLIQIALVLGFSISGSIISAVTHFFLGRPKEHRQNKQSINLSVKPDKLARQSTK